jgi:hypothetical protein
MPLMIVDQNAAGLSQRSRIPNECEVTLPSQHAPWGMGDIVPNRIEECAFPKSILKYIQPSASFFGIAVSARCAVNGFAVDENSVVPFARSPATAPHAASIRMVELSMP